MTTPGRAGGTTHVLVMAKAPVAGLAKTRLAATLGHVAAADLAAACLLDTIDAVESITSPGGRLIAMTGELADAERALEIRQRVAGWQVIDQRGSTFAAKLGNAHADAATLWGHDTGVVQIGTDTPQLTGTDLMVLADAVRRSDDPPARLALGPAVDGGWWGLATSASGQVDALVDVPMSCADTGQLTATALRSTGARVELVHSLNDVDTIDDARCVARANPHTRFAAALATLDVRNAGADSVVLAR